MLIVLAGLPGTGKTTLARALARALPAVHLRIDSVEASLHRAGIVPIDDKGYRIAYAIAEDNLRLGLTVTADSVNPTEVTRKAWVEVAKRAGVFAVEVEIVCSDSEEHRRRIDSRASDIEGLAGPTWQQVVEREYVPSDRTWARLDTAGRTIAESSAALQGLLTSRAT
jgi:predicted kinase